MTQTDHVSKNKKSKKTKTFLENSDYSELYKTKSETDKMKEKLKTEKNNVVKAQPTSGSVEENTDHVHNDTKLKKRKRTKSHNKPEITEGQENNLSIQKNNKHDSKITTFKKAKTSKTFKNKPKDMNQATESTQNENNHNAIQNNLNDLSLDSKSPERDFLDMKKAGNKKNNSPANKGKIKKGKNFKTESVDTVAKENEKPKWTAKKWNKAKKSFLDNSNVVLVSNIPLNLMLSYKKTLPQYLSNYGQVRGLGVIEVYPSVEPKPMFSTSVVFMEEAAAINAINAGIAETPAGKLHLKKILPAEETTVVVKSYGDLHEGKMSTMFAECGRIRKVTCTKKKNKSHCATCFIEFVSPDSVKKALQLLSQSKEEKKKIFASRFNSEKKTKMEKVEKPAEILKEDSTSSEESDSD